MIIWKQKCREYSPFFFSPETPAPKNNRFRGIMLLRIRSVMYTRRNMYLGAGENMKKKKLHGVYLIMFLIMFLIVFLIIFCIMFLIPHN